MLRDAFLYPIGGDAPYKPVVITAVLLSVSILVFPFILAAGYLMTVIRAAAAEKETPPEVANWQELFRQGLRGTGVVVGYVAIPTVLFLLAAVLVNPNISAEVQPGILDLIAVGCALLSLITFLAIHYFMPAGLAAAATNDDVKSAFNYRLLLQVGKSRKYLWGFFLAIVFFQFVGGILMVAFILLTAGIGLLLVPILYAVLSIQVAYIIGRSYNNALSV